MKVNKIMGLMVLMIIGISLPVNAVDFTSALNKVDEVVSTIPQYQAPLSELIQTVPATKNEIQNSIRTLQYNINNIQQEINNKQAPGAIRSISSILTQLSMITNMTLKLVMKVNMLLVPTARIVGVFDTNARTRISRVSNDTHAVVQELMSAMPQITNQINNLLTQIAEVTQQVSRLAQ